MIATPGTFPQEFGGAGENWQTKVPGIWLYLKLLLSVCQRASGQHRKQRSRETPAYPESHGSWCGNLIKQQDFYTSSCPKEKRNIDIHPARLTICLIDTQLVVIEIRILNSLNRYLLSSGGWVASLCSKYPLEYSEKRLQVQTLQTSDHDSLHVYINWHIFCQLSSHVSQQQKWKTS